MWEPGPGGEKGGRATPRLRAESPGFALVEGESVVTGAAAREALRLTPRRISSRFWSQLDTAALPRPFPEDLTHADLAHAQLSDVWREASSRMGAGVEVLLAVPASFAPDQLALLLGIARACGMPVTGLVDSAVAAASQAGTGAAAAGSGFSPRVLHVDVELHRSLVTELVAGDGVLSRTGSEVIPGVGLQRLHDAWLRHAAGEFVRRTRFDPLHAAASEQALDGQLSRAIPRLAETDTVTLEARSGGRSLTVEVTAGELAEATDSEYQVLAAALARRAGGGPVSLLLSHRAGGLPALRARLVEAVGGEPSFLSREATGVGVLAAAGDIRHGGEALPLVTRLPMAG